MNSDTKFWLLIITSIISYIVILFWSLNILLNAGGVFLNKYIDAKVASSEACAEVSGRDYEGCVDCEMLLRLDEAR